MAMPSTNSAQAVLDYLHAYGFDKTLTVFREECTRHGVFLKLDSKKTIPTKIDNLVGNNKENTHSPVRKTPRPSQSPLQQQPISRPQPLQAHNTSSVSAQVTPPVTATSADLRTKLAARLEQLGNKERQHASAQEHASPKVLDSLKSPPASTKSASASSGGRVQTFAKPSQKWVAPNHREHVAYVRHIAEHPEDIPAEIRKRELASAKSVRFSVDVKSSAQTKGKSAADFMMRSQYEAGRGVHRSQRQCISSVLQHAELQTTCLDAHNDLVRHISFHRCRLTEESAAATTVLLTASWDDTFRLFVKAAVNGEWECQFVARLRESTTDVAPLVDDENILIGVLCCNTKGQISEILLDGGSADYRVPAHDGAAIMKAGPTSLCTAGAASGVFAVCSGMGVVVFERGRYDAPLISRTMRGVASVALSDCGSVLVCAGERIETIDVASRSVLWTHQAPNAIDHVVLVTAHNVVYTSSRDNNIVAYSLLTGECTRVLSSHKNPVLDGDVAAVRFGLDSTGSYLCVPSRDSEIVLYDTKSGTAAAKLRVTGRTFEGITACCAPSLDIGEEVAAAGDDDGNVIVWSF